ncbi:MAG TPA: hypothetical protein DDY98_06880 [Ruminococcaceae bacterium]|nr:hypothetical protein [Oscillospiraceae bacterium]
MSINFMCPYCGSDLHMDESAQKLRCDACKSEYDFDEVSTQSDEELAQVLGEYPSEEVDCDGCMCDNCGAQMIADEYTSATFCSFCGAPTILPTHITGVAKPDYVLPFQVNRRQAQHAFSAWFRKKKLIPPGFLETAMAGKISGIYVPFWLFDCEVETRLHAKSSVTSSIRSGNAELVTVKDYAHYRDVIADYTDVPVDASEKMDDRLMDMLEPFDFSRAVPFEPSYTEGFCLEKYAYTKDQAFDRVRERLNGCSLQSARETLNTEGFASVTSCTHTYNRCRAKYVLLPVWTINYNYNGFTHQFFMNGQTGKIVGEPPLSLTRTLQWFGGIAAAVAALGELIWLAVNLL